MTTATANLASMTTEELKSAIRNVSRELGQVAVGSYSEPVRVGLRAKIEQIRDILASRAAL